MSRRLVGYICRKHPEGGIIPPRALTDPCGHDEPVWAEGPGDGQSPKAVAAETPQPADDVIGPDNIT